jgi:hypothetical protein
MTVAPATVPVVMAPARMACAMKAIVAKAATATAVVEVVEVAVANAKVRAKAPTQASVSVSTPKVAQWHQRLPWVLMRLASQGQIVAPAMPRKANAKNVQSVKNVVVVAGAVQTVQMCHKVKVRVAATSHKKIAKSANPEVMAVARTVVAIAESHALTVAQSAPSALPALTTEHPVHHPQKWPKAWRMAL